MNKGEKRLESFAVRKRRTLAMLRKLKRLFPNLAGTALYYRTEWQLLAAIILSARATDKQVNAITRELFKRYRDVNDYAALKPNVLSRQIKRIGLYRNKTRAIIASAKIIRAKYSGHVPKEMPALLELPGVGRKTANVFLAESCGVSAGIAVDTHVIRLTRKFVLAQGNVLALERELMLLLPKSQWSNWTNHLIAYGRKYCPARQHDCASCPLSKLYPKAART